MCRISKSALKTLHKDLYVQPILRQQSVTKDLQDVIGNMGLILVGEICVPSKKAIMCILDKTKLQSFSQNKMGGKQLHWPGSSEGRGC